MLAAELAAAKTVVIGTHVNPDGDALGSALALSLALDQLQIEHEVLCAHEAPKYLRFLPGIDRLKHQSSYKEPDLGIVVDLESMPRLGSVCSAIESANRIVVIDHHQPHEQPGDVRIIAVKAPATAAILADLFRESPVEITPDIATCLLTGILTDTGNFRYPNATSHSLRLSAELLEMGGDLRKVNENVHLTKSLPAMRLFGIALDHMKLALNEQVAWTTISQDDLERTCAKEEDTEGFVNELLAIESVKIAALLREGSSGRIKISLRSRGKVDVTAVARQFEGGGHINAAGASHDGPMAVAEQEISEAMIQCLASS